MPGNCINLKKKDERPLIQPVTGSNKSTRSHEDSAAPIGMGATDKEGRLLASLFRSGPLEPFFSRM